MYYNQIINWAIFAVCPSHCIRHVQHSRGKQRNSSEHEMVYSVICMPCGPGCCRCWSQLININHWDSFPLWESIIQPRETAFAGFCIERDLGELSIRRQGFRENSDSEGKGCFLLIVGYFCSCQGDLMWLGVRLEEGRDWNGENWSHQSMINLKKVRH